MTTAPLEGFLRQRLRCGSFDLEEAQEARAEIGAQKLARQGPGVENHND